VRSLSVKKVAVAAAGAALLGMAFAGATTVDPSVGNFQFFKNGQPQVQIVVGSNADVSDAVAAANIASMIGNLAYADQAVTATNAPAGNMTNSTMTPVTGSVTGQSVTLQVTTPAGGSVGQTGSLTINTQPYDYLDVKQLTSGTTRSNLAASTLAGDGVTVGGYEISGTNNPTIAYKGSISNVGSNTITEQEAYFLNGESYYDTSNKVYTGDRAQVAVLYNFTTPLPYYLGSTLDEEEAYSNGTVAPSPFDAGSLVNGTYFDSTGNQIQTDDDNLIQNGDVAIQFLGQPYVVTGFPSTYPVTGSLSLGQSAVIQQLGAGDTINVGNETVTLVSISPIATTNNEPSAYFTLSEGSTVIDNFNLQPGETYDQNGVVVTAQQVFVGTGSTSYVKAAVYSQAIVMTNGQKLAFEGNDSATTLDNDAGWVSDLNWTTVNVGSQPVPALSSLELTETTTSNKITPGTSFDVLATPVAKQLTFLGLQSVPTDTLRVIAEGNERFNINAPGTYIAGNVSDNGTGGVTVAGVTVNPAGISSNVGPGGNGYNYVELQSGDSSAFQFGNGDVTTLWINKDLGSILYQDTSDSNYTYVPGLTVTNTSSGYTAQTNVTYEYPSSPMANNIGLYVKRTGPANVTTLSIIEPVVMNNPSGSSGFGSFNIDLYYNPTDSNYGSNLFNTTAGNSNTLTVPYSASAPGLNSTVNFGNGSQDQGYVTPGGSVLSNVGNSEVDVQYPQSLPMVQWWFGTPSNVTVSVGGSTVSTTTLDAGQNYTIGDGYSIQVSSIGGSASCTGGAGTASAAVCSPSTASVVTPLDTDTNPLVVLDSQANPSDQLVVVGGPWVNSIAAGLTGADTATETPGDSVVTVIGNDVLVAGYGAQDTTDAANALIDWLSANRDTVRNT